jgi:uncharacterized protein
VRSPAVDLTSVQTLAALRRLLPGAERIETHTAYLFLLPTQVLKLKKAIRLPHLDHRTLRAREHACREELRLNRQLAGDVYGGLVALRRDDYGALCFGEEGRIVDWLVEMRRLPSARMLDRLIETHQQILPSEVVAIGETLAAFYRERRWVAPVKGVYLRHLELQTAINIRELGKMRQHLGNSFNEPLIQQSATVFSICRTEISQREQDKLILEGHGDLRPEHVCLTTPPTIYDQLEFSRLMRTIDIHDEVGLLGLECDLLGVSWIGDLLRHRMQLEGFAPPTARLRAAYGIFRCLTRARLSIVHLQEPHPRTPEKWPQQAKRYLERAEGFMADLGRESAAPPRLEQ